MSLSHPNANSHFPAPVSLHCLNKHRETMAPPDDSNTPRRRQTSIAMRTLRPRTTKQGTGTIWNRRKDKTKFSSRGGKHRVSSLYPALDVMQKAPASKPTHGWDDPTPSRASVRPGRMLGSPLPRHTGRALDGRSRKNSSADNHQNSAVRAEPWNS